MPFLLIISAWIKFDSPGPIFFRQERVGRFGVPFKIHKFRTMFVNTESLGLLTVGNDTRITRSGLFLRRSKIDEFPQLFDVLRGRMSLVGPRPEVSEFLNYYPSDVRQKILSIRPGITDKASIEMVDENFILSNYDDPQKAYIDIILPIKQSYYLDYLESQNFLYDIKLIVLTFKKIVSR